MRIAILGVGNLGSAVAKRLLVTGCAREDIVLITRGSHTSARRCEELGIAPSTISEISKVDTVILTVKPQDVASAASSLRGILQPHSLVVSLIAGVSCATLQELTGHACIARAMPNLGAIIGESATVYYLSARAEGSKENDACSIISSLGKSWKVTNEHLVDLATAVAGSGPAYVCWLAEQMERVAQDHGLSATEAHALVLQTLKGTTAFLEFSQTTFADLRERVTSPQGTTAAALRVLDNAQAGQCLQEAVKAAFSRAVQLGAQVSGVTG
jgi:pyrroline-5-carboxylate reductase